MELHEISLVNKLAEDDVQTGVSLAYTDLHPALVTWGEWIVNQFNLASIDNILGWGLDGDGDATINITFMTADRYDTAGSIMLVRDGDMVRLLLYDIMLEKHFDATYPRDMSSLDDDAREKLSDDFLGSVVELVSEKCH